MHKMTQAEFDALNPDADGCIQIPDDTDCTKIFFNSDPKLIQTGDRCKFASFNRFRFDSEFGDENEFKDFNEFLGANKFGNGTKFGRCTIFGEFIDVRADFENGAVKNGLYITVGNIGSLHRTAYFFIDENGKLFVRAGCWFSDMNEFKARVQEVHTGTIHYITYMAACKYAETVLPVMLAAANEKEELNNAVPAD